MAKITRHGGVSDATTQPPDDTEALAGDEIPERFQDPETQPSTTVAGEHVEELQGDAEPDPDRETAPESTEDAHDDVSGASEEPVDHEPPTEEPDDRGADGNPVPEPEPEEQPPSVNLPPANALKSVWEESLLGAGFSREWVEADGRTKDALIEAGRGLADGTVRIEGGEPVPNKDG